MPPRHSVAFATYARGVFPSVDFISHANNIMQAKLFSDLDEKTREVRVSRRIIVYKRPIFPHFDPLLGEFRDS